MRPKNEYGMSSDPTDPDRLVMTPEKQKRQDALARDETGSFEPVDDPLDATDLDDDDDDDGGIDVSALDDDKPEEEPVSKEPEAAMVHACENCGSSNTVLPPPGYMFVGKAKPDEVAVARAQRTKHVDEADAASFVFKESYKDACKPRRAPFPW